MAETRTQEAPLSAQAGSGPSRVRAWLRAYRVPILFTLLLLAVFAMRDLWSPDEPDFAQCVREMRERGSWLLPYLNGQPYSEKPILFYWLMKASAMACDALTGGLGFTRGVAAWALRLPSVAASAAFLFGLRAWAARFLPDGTEDLAPLILASTPIWLWQSQTIQIDMVFAALLAWGWLAWIAGWLLARGEVEARRPWEAKAWLLAAYAAMALAFLAKGPLALVLSFALVMAFLAWQRDFRSLGRTLPGAGILLMAALVLPWYFAAALKGGPAYAYQMIIHQNLERALRAWDHIQPFWKYVQYLLGDFFPWCLLLPALAVFLKDSGAFRSPLRRFLALAFAVPFILLSCSQSKQGKYLLMAYPFLALLLAGRLRAPRSPRLLGGVLAAALGLPGLALAAVAFFHAGGRKLLEEVHPYLGPLKVCALMLVLGAAALASRAAARDGRRIAREAAATLALVFLVAGTWGFRLLDARKSWRGWTRAAEPLMEGRRVFFWQTIRSGAMVYTDHLMPEIRAVDGLLALGPEDRVVAISRDWDSDAQGLDASVRAKFTVLARVPVGEGETLLLRPNPPVPAPTQAKEAP